MTRSFKKISVGVTALLATLMFAATALAHENMQIFVYVDEVRTVVEVSYTDGTVETNETQEYTTTDLQEVYTLLGIAYSDTVEHIEAAVVEIVDLADEEITEDVASTDNSSQGEMNFDQFSQPVREVATSQTAAAPVLSESSSVSAQSDEITALQAQVRKLMQELILLLSFQLSQIPR